MVQDVIAFQPYGLRSCANQCNSEIKIGRTEVAFGNETIANGVTFTGTEMKTIMKQDIFYSFPILKQPQSASSSEIYQWISTYSMEKYIDIYQLMT